MSLERYQVLDYTFKTKSEYEAALKDLKIVEELKKQYQLKTPKDFVELYQELQNGTIVFETIVGRNFDDEIYATVEKLKKNGDWKDNSPNFGVKKQVNGKQKKEQKKIKLDDLDDALRAEVLKVLRKKERNRKLIIVTLSLVALLSFGYFGYDYYNEWKLDTNTEQYSKLKDQTLLDGNNKKIVVNKKVDEVEIPDVLPQYLSLYNLNKKLAGWLKIEDTIIDYPVMQTTDNEYYLEHNFEQEKDKNGSLFLDTDCDIISRNTNLIIYGHRMQSGKMFGSLELYKDKSYYEKHKTIQFDTIYEEGTYEVMYVFRSKIFYEEDITFKYYQFFDAFSKEEFDSYMKEMSSMSFYDTGITAEYGDQLLTLSTCDYYEEDGRFVVVAKRVK